MVPSTERDGNLRWEIVIIFGRLCEVDEGDNIFSYTNQRGSSKNSRIIVPRTESVIT